MKFLKIFTENLRKRLRVLLTSKRLVILISIGSLVGTLLFVKVLKGYSSKDVDEKDAFLYEMLKGKKAVSVVFNLSSLPMEFIYPGVKVDIVERNDKEVAYVVKDVDVVGVSIVEEGTKAKLIFAVSNEESEKIIKKTDTTLGIIVRGYGNNKESDDIEIVEL